MKNSTMVSITSVLLIISCIYSIIITNNLKEDKRILLKSLINLQVVMDQCDNAYNTNVKILDAQAKDNTLSSGDLCDMFSDNDGNGAPMSKHALEELITRLRRKFKLLTTGNYDGAVQSVWGVGYQLCIPVVLED